VGGSVAMNALLGACPVCGQPLGVTRLHCRGCDTTIEGDFAIGVFDRLSAEHRTLAEAFLRHDGKLNRMASEMNMSYPTLRARLDDLRRAMGFEVEQADTPPTGTTDEERRRILDDLAAGRVSYEDAIRSLQG
jgi:hypothetical protein